MKNEKHGLFRLISFLKQHRALTALITCVLIVNMLITASVAWFSLNRTTDADDIGMSLAVDDTEAVYKAYMYDHENGVGTDYLEDVGELNVTNIDLNQYDTIFQLHNKYTPAFARIEIFRHSSMAKNGTVHVTISRQSLKDIADAATWPAPYSSSILRFTALIVEDQVDRHREDLLNDAEGHADALYHFINDAMYSKVENYSDSEFSKTFIPHNADESGHGHQKLDQITVSIDYTEDDWYRYENGEESLYVYLYMSYDVNLIKCYMRDHSSGGISIDDNTVLFKNDLKKIVVSYTNKEN